MGYLDTIRELARLGKLPPATPSTRSNTAVLTQERVTVRADKAAEKLEEYETNEVNEKSADLPTLPNRAPAKESRLVNYIRAVTRLCPTCGCSRWWERPKIAGGGIVCGICHPDPQSGAPIPFAADGDKQVGPYSPQV